MHSGRAARCLICDHWVSGSDGGSIWLETNPRVELNGPRRIGDAGDAAEVGVGDVQVRAGEADPVEDVEGVGLQAEFDFFVEDEFAFQAQGLVGVAGAS